MIFSTGKINNIVVLIISTVISVLFTLTPIIPFVEVFQRKAKIDILPDVMLFSHLLSKLLLCSVCVIKKNLIFFIIYTFSILATSIFLTLYLFLYFKQIYKKILLCFFLLLIIEIFIFIGTVFIENVEVISFLEMIFDIIMYISPGKNIFRVIKERNSKLLPIYSLIIMILLSGCWVIYGISNQLVFLIISNSVGLFFSIVYTLIWMYFYTDVASEKIKDGETFAIIKNTNLD